MKVIAKKINNPNCDYLTEGKEYEAYEGSVTRNTPMLFDNGSFVIVDDVGDEVFTSFKGCNHIEGNWTIITDKAKVR